MPRAAVPRPELLGLLAACKERPDDDGPRLVLADWLEENGESDPAAFVRAQVRRANEIEGTCFRTDDDCSTLSTDTQRSYAEWVADSIG